MLTLILSSSLMVHSYFPNPKSDEPKPDVWEPKSAQYIHDTCPKDKSYCHML